MLIEVIADEYKGWRGVLQGIVKEARLPCDNILSVTIVAPPFDESAEQATILLPQGWMKKLVPTR